MAEDREVRGLNLAEAQSYYFQNFSFPLFTTAEISFFSTIRDFKFVDLNVQLELITV